jgi:hypothetical protein
MPTWTLARARSDPRVVLAQGRRTGVPGGRSARGIRRPGRRLSHRVVIAEELGYTVAGASIAPSVIGDGLTEILFKNASEELTASGFP